MCDSCLKHRARGTAFGTPEKAERICDHCKFPGTPDGGGDERPNGEAAKTTSDVERALSERQSLPAFMQAAFDILSSPEALATEGLFRLAPAKSALEGVKDDLLSD